MYSAAYQWGGQDDTENEEESEQHPIDHIRIVRQRLRMGQIIWWQEDKTKRKKYNEVNQGEYGFKNGVFYQPYNPRPETECDHH